MDICPSREVRIRRYLQLHLLAVACQQLTTSTARNTSRTTGNIHWQAGEQSCEGLALAVPSDSSAASPLPAVASLVRSQLAMHMRPFASTSGYHNHPYTSGILAKFVVSCSLFAPSLPRAPPASCAIILPFVWMRVQEGEPNTPRPDSNPGDRYTNPAAFPL